MPEAILKAVLDLMHLLQLNLAGLWREGRWLSRAAAVGGISERSRRQNFYRRRPGSSRPTKPDPRAEAGRLKSPKAAISERLI